MSIDEAIKILTFMGTAEFEGNTEDILAARKLGIEALKRVKTYKESPLCDDYQLLPGETEK